MEDLETPAPPEAAEPSDSGATDSADQAELAVQPPDAADAAAVSMEEFLSAEPEPEAVSQEDAQLRAVIEAIVYVAEEPLTLAQLAAALQQPAERIRGILDQVITDFDKPEHGVTVREVAGGYKMATKPEHHEAVRAFVKSALSAFFVGICSRFRTRDPRTTSSHRSWCRPGDGEPREPPIAAARSATAPL